MFDFEKLDVYQKAKAFNKSVYHFLLKSKLENPYKDQLKRASFSIMLNIAEGTSRFSQKDKRHFYVISRGSAFECLTIFDFLVDENLLNNEQYNQFYKQAEELSKILFALIKKLS